MMTAEELARLMIGRVVERVVATDDLGGYEPNIEEIHLSGGVTICLSGQADMAYVWHVGREEKID